MYNKIYIKHIYNIFIIRFIYITLVFSSLIFVLGILEELKFFSSNDETGIGTPILLTILNFPSILFEIFPFIILITTQFFFIKFQDNDEILIFKNNGINNLKIIFHLSLLVFIIGITLITVFHFMSSNMKKIYLEFKNKHTEDQKYLAVINENGLWIKDKLEDQTLIIHSEEIDNNKLRNIIIAIYDSGFRNQDNIIAKEADITTNIWLFKDAIIFNDDGKKKTVSNLEIKTNFDYIKINSLFSNLESLDIFKLLKQRKDFESVGLSILDIEIYINKILSLPFNLLIFLLLSCVLMFNIRFIKSKSFVIIFGILLSAVMYYIYYFFGLLGSNNKLPILIAIWLPNLILFLSCLVGIVNINEK